MIEDQSAFFYVTQKEKMCWNVESIKNLTLREI